MYGEYFDSKEYLRNATLMDDKFMNLCLTGNIPAVSAMLMHILGRDIELTKVETQKELQGPGRSLRLDVWAEDGKFAIFNEEFQNESRGAEPRRLRYHCSMIDVNCLKAGQDFGALPECWVIFITRHDVFGQGKTMYKIDRYIEGTDERFNDGQHLVYVNCAAEDDGSKVWKLIHDLLCKNPDEMLIPELAETVSRFKRTEEGETKMDAYFDYFVNKEVDKAVKKALKQEVDKATAKGKAEGLAEGLAEGKVKGKAEGLVEGKAEGLAEAISKLLQSGAMTLEKIAETFSMPLAEVQAIANHKP